MTLQTFEPVLDTDGGHVLCWFCHPEQYPTMPIGHTLCARCGVFMVGDVCDPANEAMIICYGCQEELGVYV